MKVPEGSPDVAARRAVAKQKTSARPRASMPVPGPHTARLRSPPPWRGGKLRRATLSDLATLSDHRHRMFTEIGGRTRRELAAHVKGYRAWVAPRLKSGEIVVFLVEAGAHGAVARGGRWPRPAPPRPEAPHARVPYLFSMYTEPGFRGRGLASRIVREAIRRSRRQGYTRVVLHAAPLGRRVYRRLGFERSWEMRLLLGH